MAKKKETGPKPGTLSHRRQRSSMSIGTLAGLTDDCARIMVILDSLIEATRPRTHTTDIPSRVGWVLEISEGVLPEENRNDLATFKLWVERLRSGAESQRDKVKAAREAFTVIARQEEADAKARGGY